MTLKQIASLGKELTKFLALFACCFRSRPGFAVPNHILVAFVAKLRLYGFSCSRVAFAELLRILENDGRQVWAAAHGALRVVGSVVLSGLT